MDIGQHSSSSLVKTTCPYCGVGCGVVAEKDASGAWCVRGDEEHPANFGRLCSKGAALADTLSAEGRLTQPVVDGQEMVWDEALSEVAKRIQQVIDAHGKNAFAIYASGQLLTEDYYVANKWMKGFIGSANIDTNSRLCMASAVAGHKRAFGADTVPCQYSDLEAADLLVIIGSNTAWCHPVLFQRIRQAREDRPQMKIVVIDPRATATLDIADHHLAIRPGTDDILFSGLMVYLFDHGYLNESFIQEHTNGLDEAIAAARRVAEDIESVAEQCDLSVASVQALYDLYARTEKTVSFFSQGINQSSTGVDKVNLIINCHLMTGRIGRTGMGPFSITGQPNAMGGREVGGFANTLAAHMDFNEDNVERLGRFWNSGSVASEEGHKAVDLFDAMLAGKIKAVWIMATNPMVSLPDTSKIKAALASCELVIVSDCKAQTDTTDVAHVLFPAAAWGEKNGTVTNSERRISRQRPFLSAPGAARPDWWIISQVASRMGHAAHFDYSSAADIFREHAKLSGFENEGQRDFDISALSELRNDQYDQLTPIRWPVEKNNLVETQEVFSDGKFFTDNGKAKVIPVTRRLSANATTADFPLYLNTGRVRDQWHTMTRTAMSERLCEHTTEPFLDIHPDDAEQNAVQDQQLIEIESVWGVLVTRARISDAVSRGSVFMPIHWNRQFASTGSVCRLIGSIVDPISGEPEYKQTPVRITPVETGGQFALLASRDPIEFEGAKYWVKQQRNGYYLTILTGLFDARSIDNLKSRFTDENDEWMSYQDSGRKQLRCAVMRNNRLQLFAWRSETMLPFDPGWMAKMFTHKFDNAQDRAALLAGKAMAYEDSQGAIVCACNGVGINTICSAIHKDGCNSVEKLGQCVNAGTNCGSCIPELRKILAAAETQAA